MSFDRDGEYRYELVVDDGELSSTASLTVDVLPAENFAVISWSPPARNADGSELDDLAGYFVYFGGCPANPGACDPGDLDPDGVVDVGSSTELRLDDLGYGETYYFYVTSYDFAKNESLPSTPVFKRIP